MTDDYATITVCQGPPRCGLQDDDAMAAQIAGCPWCTRIYVGEDGSEAITAPSSDVRAA